MGEAHRIAGELVKLYRHGAIGGPLIWRRPSTHGSFKPWIPPTKAVEAEKFHPSPRPCETKESKGRSGERPGGKEPSGHSNVFIRNGSRDPMSNSPKQINVGTSSTSSPGELIVDAKLLERLTNGYRELHDKACLIELLRAFRDPHWRTSCRGFVAIRQKSLPHRAVDAQILHALTEGYRQPPPAGQQETSQDRCERSPSLYSPNKALMTCKLSPDHRSRCPRSLSPDPVLLNPNWVVRLTPRHPLALVRASLLQSLQVRAQSEREPSRFRFPGPPHDKVNAYWF